MLRHDIVVQKLIRLTERLEGLRVKLPVNELHGAREFAELGEWLELVYHIVHKHCRVVASNRTQLIVRGEANHLDRLAFAVLTLGVLIKASCVQHEQGAVKLADRQILAKG